MTINGNSCLSKRISINPFRNNVNDVRKLSTLPVQQVTTASEKVRSRPNGSNPVFKAKTANQIRKRQPTVTALQIKVSLTPLLKNSQKKERWECVTPSQNKTKKKNTNHEILGSHPLYLIILYCVIHVKTNKQKLQI